MAIVLAAAFFLLSFSSSSFGVRSHPPFVSLLLLPRLHFFCYRLWRLVFSSFPCEEKHRSCTEHSAGARLDLSNTIIASIVDSTPCSGSTMDQPIANPQGLEAKAD
jgi:hypothetical protein